jgi:hypothetical protein
MAFAKMQNEATAIWAICLRLFARPKRPPELRLTPTPARIDCAARFNFQRNHHEPQH